MTEREYISRSEAKARGLKRFYGGPCKMGHDCEQYVVNGGCVDCTRGKARAAADKNKDKPAITGGANFKWTDANRQRLIDTYVDTGDIEGARTAIGVLPSEYHRELERNHEFKEAVTTATGKALQTLEDKAMGHALRGNEKLALAILKAKFPEQYSEKIKVDNTHTHTVKGLSDEELNKRISRLSSGRVIDHVPSRKSPVALIARGESETGIQTEDPELLPG